MICRWLLLINLADVTAKLCDLDCSRMCVIICICIIVLKTLAKKKYNCTASLFVYALD